MSGPGDLIYRCRRCGKLHHAWYVDEVAASLARAMQVEPHPLVPTMTCLHECGAGEHGVCDLIGASVVAVAGDAEAEADADAPPGESDEAKGGGG